jgi:hypothetical protein
MPQTPHEQTRTHEQQHRECALHHEQHGRSATVITTIPSTTL